MLHRMLAVIGGDPAKHVVRDVGVHTVHKCGPWLPERGVRPLQRSGDQERPGSRGTKRSLRLLLICESASRSGLRWFEISQTERGLTWLSPEPALNQA